MPIPFRAAAFPVMICAALIGCGGDDNGLLDPGGACEGLGTFSATLSGAVSGAISGCSFFVVSPATQSNPADFAISLSAGDLHDPTHLITLIGRGSRPVNGVYAVSEDEDELNVSVDIYEPPRIFIMTGGTMTITSSSVASLSGTLDMSGTELGGSAELSFTGTFQAKCLHTIPGAPC